MGEWEKKAGKLRKRENDWAGSRLVSVVTMLLYCEELHRYQNFVLLNCFSKRTALFHFDEAMIFQFDFADVCDEIPKHSQVYKYFYHL